VTVRQWQCWENWLWYYQNDKQLKFLLSNENTSYRICCMPHSRVQWIVGIIMVITFAHFSLCICKKLYSYFRSAIWCHRLTWPWFPVRPENLRDSSRNKGYKWIFFHCTCAKRPYLYIRSNMWLHHCVRRPRFPMILENFSKSSIDKVYMHIFYCVYTKWPYFYIWSEIRLHRCICPPQFPVRRENFGDSSWWHDSDAVL